MLTAITEEVFETLASSPSSEVYDSLISTAMPPLSTILVAPEDGENLSSASVAVELLNAILQGRKADLGDSLGPRIWPGLFRCMLTTEDSDTVQVSLRSANARLGLLTLFGIQYGCNALTTFVRRTGPQLFSWCVTRKIDRD